MSKIKLTFEWDEKKARANLAKHRISFENAATVFGDPNAITIYDDSHSTNEHRYATMGYTIQGSLIVVTHTDRGNRIRIISARKTTAREKRNYEEGI